MKSVNYKEEASSFFLSLQKKIHGILEEYEPEQRFRLDKWERPEKADAYGGGGISGVLEKGNVFEKAGVNFSAVEGFLPLEMTKKLIGKSEEARFFATGISLVIHPRSPMIPTTHANLRFLQVADLSWFGGGADLTPYYIFEEDAEHFHSVLKKNCDDYDTSWYPRFKKTCDEYFYLPHRKEARGIGGIFFDYLGKEDSSKLDNYFSFVKQLGEAWTETYLPIVDKRLKDSWGEKERHFQKSRRGRYVEFNLLHDKGTHFGLKTNGRTESILMSLPPEVIWDYSPQYEKGYREAKTLEVLSGFRDWV